MTDRDLPLVPVTTLAGLTSLSDLLSELPVSDSLSSVTSLNKSLLFHTLVAEESNNLLSVRDDNLVRQLVHAIEQTNSDTIELKSQYAHNQPSTNISAYPELLQGIYTFRPTVFTTPVNQRIQHQQQTAIVANSPQQQQQYQHQSQHFLQHQQQSQQQVSQQNHQHLSRAAVNVIQNVPDTHNQQHIANNFNNITIQQYPVVTEVKQQPQIIQQVVVSPPQHGGANNILNTAYQTPIVETPSKRTRRQAANDPQDQQSSAQQQPLLYKSAASPVINHQPSSIILHSPPNKSANVPPPTPPTPVQQQTVILQSPQTSPVVAQQSVIIQQRIQQPATAAVSNSSQSNLDIRPTEAKVINVQTISPLLKEPTTEAKVLKVQTLTPPQREPTEAKVLKVQTISPSQQQQSEVKVLKVQTISPPQKQPLALIPVNPPLSQKTIPSKNEFLQQGQTPPVQASSVALETQQEQQLSSQTPESSSVPLNNNNSSPTENSDVKSSDETTAGQPVLKPKVCVTRLKAEDEILMQQSLKKFAKKSPELAKKLGIDEPVVPVPMAAGKGGDLFTEMKMDEKRVAAKRKSTIVREDIPPEKIYSQPKVRRVERIVAAPTPKCSKEEVMRSQAYQQFMKNMDQIIELLDDTEPPNLNSEETDETIDCISSKMLHVMSNDVAKLKAKGVLDSIPKNKLTLLINYAMRNVYLAKNYSAGPDDDEDIIADEVMEKILNAIEACLLICNIYSTAKDLKFLQEDNITLILKFIHYQLRETIYPSYDPVYNVKSMKKTDHRKKSKAHNNHNRNLQLLYSKGVELMKVLVTLFDKCIFVDTIVLTLSTMTIEPFFVENIDTLQFVCLELVTTIFRKECYEKIRSSILQDIFTSIDRLSSSKKNLRPFKLANNGGNIQMVTALVLQLIQCATILPESFSSNKKKIKLDGSGDGPNAHGEKEAGNKDVVILSKFEVAITIGANFLSTFLNKCKSRSNETDFRPLFENIINDLLATANKPEWPASELLLSLLGTLLVRSMADKTKEQSIRLASLDYLGIVAARLRKDTVESRCKVNIMDAMIKSIKAEQEKEGDLPVKNSKVKLDPEEERTEFLQQILLDFLAVNAQEENQIWDYARHFYLVQWYRDILNQRKRIADGEKGYASRRKKKTSKKKRKKDDGSSDESSENETSDEDDEEDNRSEKNSKSRKNDVVDQELNLEIFHILDERKKYLIGKIKPYSDMNCTSQHIKTYIDYNNAQLIAQYLASKRPFSQSFDRYLQKIILVVKEPAIAIRTRAMKCLANIVEVDPLVLKRKDMQMGVNQKFLDSAISVREAAVDLIGKYVLSSEDLIDQYYEMLSMRILDTGVSVRKRVIKILRDICIEYPDFDKIPEICVKMIRRVNDEEGIQKLVTEVFMRMWFTACKDNDRVGVQRKINQIIDVVNTAHDTGTTWLEGLLNSIFAPKETNNLKLDGTASEPVRKNTEPPAEIVLACQQLADGLVERLIELEDKDNTLMLGCITTLHLLAKVRPQLLVRHAITIEPYLNIKCQTQADQKFICAVADILEQVVPLVVNPSDTFLASLEEHLMILIISLSQAVVSSCVSCLGALVNKITKNYKLIRDCFSKFYRVIDGSRDQLVKNPNISVDSIYTPAFRRSLFTIGILMRFFDFKSPKVLGLEGGGTGSSGISQSICDQVFDCLMFYMTCSNLEIRKQALISLGYFCVQNDDYLTRMELRDFYCNLLKCDTVQPHIKIVCMRNIWVYLTESEIYMHNKEKDWEKQAQTDDLKEMNDVSSGMASRIIQLYLQDILNCFLHTDAAVRLWAVKVIQIVLRQGLVHPVRMVPYLIALSTDERQEAAHRADALLKDIDKTYSGFVNMKLQLGLQLSFQMQELLQCKSDNNVIRGYVKRDKNTIPSSLNDFLYSLLRNTKPQRRALVQTVTKQFDDQKTTLRQMLFLADNLAYFPYVVQDEPLYLIHQVDLMISVAGTNLLSTFKEGLKAPETERDILEDDDDVEDPDVLFVRLPEDTSELQKCITSAQGCMLMLFLKQHLKDMYGLTDGKISRYSPSETQKIYEKAITRKPVKDFHPKSTIDVVKRGADIAKELSDEERKDLIVKYLEFKQLMLKLDPDDVDSLDEDAANKSKLNNTTLTSDATPTTPLNTTSASQNLDDTTSASGGGIGAPSPHVNNIKQMTVSTPVQSKENAVTPTSRSTKANKHASSRKQPTRSKRKKRKILTSDEEDDDSFDEDYS